MYISRLQVGNYKSFRESAPLELTQGFNIIAGQNNSGKTALLEAIGLNFLGKPHRSLKTVPARDTVADQISWVDVSFTLPTLEVKELLLSFPAGSGFQVVKPVVGSEYANTIAFRDDSVTSMQNLVGAIFSEKSLTFRIRRQAAAGQQASWSLLRAPSFGLYEPQLRGGSYVVANFTIDGEGRLTGIAGDQISGPTDFGLQLAQAFQRHVYRFEAERMKVGKGSHGGGTVLTQDASNLPEVLNQLQHNSALFRELNEQLSVILPQVRWVSVRGVGQGQVEIVAGLMTLNLSAKTWLCRSQKAAPASGKCLRFYTS